MSKNLWLAALASLALAGPASAQTGSQDTYGGSGTTSQQGSSEQGAEQGGSIGAGQEGSQQGTTFGQGQQGATQGQQGTMQAQPGAQQQGSTFASNQLTGKIQNVDPNAKSVTIAQPDGSQQSLKMGQNATVFMQGKLGSFQDLKEGQQVRAAYENQNGQKTLRWIEVTPNAQGTQGQQQMQPGAQPQDQQMQNQAAPQQAEPQQGDQGGGSDVDQGSQQGMQGAQGMQQGMHQHEIVGQVVKVQPDEHQLVLSHRGKQMTLNLTKDADIFVNGKKASLSDLKEGQEVRAALEPSQQERTAIRVETIGQAQQKSEKSQKSQKGSQQPQDQNF